MSERISKKATKKFIDYLENEKLKKIQEEIEELQEEQENSRINICGDALESLYLQEEYVKGEIRGAKYVLYNCF